MLVSLAAAWKEIEKDDGIRATIVTGAGKSHFRPVPILEN